MNMKLIKLNIFTKQTTCSIVSIITFIVKYNLEKQLIFTQNNISLQFQTQSFTKSFSKNLHLVLAPFREFIGD